MSKQSSLKSPQSKKKKFDIKVSIDLDQVIEKEFNSSKQNSNQLSTSPRNQVSLFKNVAKAVGRFKHSVHGGHHHLHTTKHTSGPIGRLIPHSSTNSSLGNTLLPHSSGG